MKKAVSMGKYIFPEDELNHASDIIIVQKNKIRKLHRLSSEQSATLAKYKAELNDLQAVLFDMRQKGLFDGEGTETFEQLRDLIGDEYASKVVHAFAGTALYIPKNVISDTNHRRIKKEFREGATYRELSKRYGYTERYIRSIVHRKGPKAAKP